MSVVNSTGQTTLAQYADNGNAGMCLRRIMLNCVRRSIIIEKISNNMKEGRPLQLGDRRNGD